ncbi:MAG TPA: hypothetical protein VF590_19595, partial [Isosphaeraceae bacterium]
LPEAEPLEFPDLVPLGRGTVETYLALVDASGRPLEVEGTRGIEPVDDSRFPPEDDEGPGLSRRVYRVRHEGWSLRIRAGGGPAAPGAEEARVVLADVACVLAGDGSAWGEASLDVEPRTGAFVGLDLPAESQAVAATVGGQPARPLRATSGRWLVPLGDGVSGRVVVVWRSDRAASGPAGDRVVPLPGLTRARVPLLVTVHAPDSWRIEVAAGAAHPAPAEALEAARAEALRTRIVATLDDVDRASARDRRALIAALAGFEIRARQAERRARWAPTVRFPAAPEAQRPVLQRLEEMRSLLAEDLRLAGFDALAAESRARLGLAGSDPGEGLIIPSEPPAPLRVRRLGRPRHFSGQTDAQGAPPTLRVVPPASS